MISASRCLQFHCSAWSSASCEAQRCSCSSSFAHREAWRIWNEHFGDKEQFWQENVSLDLTSKNTEKILNSAFRARGCKRRHWDGKCHLSDSLFYSISMFLCNRNDRQRASRFANCSNALLEAFAATAVRSRVESLYLVCTFREETHRCPVAGFTCIWDVMDILGWSFVFSLSRNMEREDFFGKKEQTAEAKRNHLKRFGKEDVRTPIQKCECLHLCTEKGQDSTTTKDLLVLSFNSLLFWSRFFLNYRDSSFNFWTLGQLRFEHWQRFYVCKCLTLTHQVSTLRDLSFCHTCGETWISR